MANPSRLPFASIRSEGALLPADLLQRVASGDPALPGVDPDSYHVPANEKLSEAISRSWARLSGVWLAFSDRLAATVATDPATGLTRERWLLPLFEELGYGRLQPARAHELHGRAYPISHFWHLTPLHLVGANLDLDRRTAGAAGAARVSPHGLVQDFLNRSEDSIWGFVSNGRMLRLLRDNLSLTRQAYVEFDLETMMTGELFADFAVLWLTCHQSRVEGEKQLDCRLERWMGAAREQGVRALDDLRQGVESAIGALGSGFLSHPENGRLRDRLRVGTLLREDLYRQVLRLVYQLLFLFSAEDRDALLSPGSPQRARDVYRSHYSTARLRDMAERHRGSRHADLYSALRLVIRGLGKDEGIPALGIAALGGFLFSGSATADIREAELSNAHLLEAVRALAFVQSSGKLRRVDFKNLGSDELGSVYESLLELHPEINVDTGGFGLRTTAGSERKTTGSYYTPTSLINCLLDTALDPVLSEASGKAEPEKAILALRVCDPACGSGHFLVAAAHRIAKRLAAVSTGEEEPAPGAFRNALRDVVGHCLYGVDINPMAVELCKVALWMEAVEPGKPLSFLDHHIRCGNSLLGATPKLLAEGIPDEAFKPIEGDDKREVTALRKKNREQRKGQLGLIDHEDKPMGYGELAESIRELDSIDDLSIAGVHEKESRYGRIAESTEYRRARLAADAWCSAFVCRKSGDAPSAITHDTFLHISRNPEAVLPEVRAEIQRLAAQYQFFHWHLAFPDVFRVNGGCENELTGWNGGFDVVLGNPPWEHTELKEKEWFATRSPDIVAASTGASRKRQIAALQNADPTVFFAFQSARRVHEGVAHLLGASGRYPLCGRGRINTYAVFAELKRSLISPRGRVGCIVPSGIATDDTTKHFFQDLVGQGALSSLYDFQSGPGLFGEIGHARFKFCLLTLIGGGVRHESLAELAFFLRDTRDLADPARRFRLSAEDIALVNPNTRTCPIFRSQRDAEITKAIYARVPVLIRGGPPEENPWRLSFSQGLFNMTSDSHLFRTRDPLEADGWKLEGNVFTKDGKSYLPLYEAKMIHQFDHRFGDYSDHPPGAETTHLPDVPVARLQDPEYVVQPRYWVPGEEVEDRLGGKWDRKWLMGWRDICRSTDERTVIASILPRVGVGNKLPLMVSTLQKGSALAILPCLLSSFILDYAARTKVGGTNLNYFVYKQLPTLTPITFGLRAAWATESGNLDWLLPRVIELTYTASDLAPFAKDCGYDGPPFRWDEERRFMLRCELDAAFFHLYGVSRDDADYIMDTFPIVRRKDEAAYGEYRTKRAILEIYDAMRHAIDTGIAYRTLLDPPPADPSLAHVSPDRTREDRSRGLQPARPPFRRIEPRDEDKYRTCVPLYTLKAAAGAFGASQPVDPDGWVEIQTTHKLRPGMFVAQVTGRSMEPKIPDGSYCLFSCPVEGSREGRILLVQHHAIHDPETGGSYTIKKYHSEKTVSPDGDWHHHVILLEPSNPDFPAIELRDEDARETRVIAELVDVVLLGGL